MNYYKPKTEKQSERNIYDPSIRKVYGRKKISSQFFTPHQSFHKNNTTAVNDYLGHRFKMNKQKEDMVLSNKKMSFHVVERSDDYKENNFITKKYNETTFSATLSKKISSIRKIDKLKRKEQQETKKLMKIKSLFVINNFERVQLNYITQNWTYLTQVYECFLKSTSPSSHMLLVLKNFYPIKTILFINSFTNYNDIKNKVNSFYFLMIWSTIIFAYADDVLKEELRIKTLDLFEGIFKYLVKNSFYISLIISKALKNGFLRNNKTYIDDFSKSLCKFQFETGVPLIKTLKNNNDKIFSSLKFILNSINVRLAMQFEKSYLRDLDCLKESTKNLISTFKDKVTKDYQKAMNVLIFNVKRFFLNINTDMVVRQQSMLVTEPPKRKFTLVFDLDETLIHFHNNGNSSKFLIRPHTYDILKNLSPFFELIIFTAAQKEYADWIIDRIDPKKVISHRFYREHCLMGSSSHIKDISRLNRDLSKIVIIDNFAENFILQKENGIYMRPWFNDVTDDALINLERYFLEFIQSGMEDIRQYIELNKNTDAGEGFLILS